MIKKRRLPLRTDPVLVLGMHRSGTTLLTRILSRLGIFTGHTLLEGRHEPLYFLDLDDELLNIAHAAWDSPLNVNYFLENEDYKKRVVNFIRFRMTSPRFVRSYVGLKNAWQFYGPQKCRWSIKEPRMTVLWSLWKEVFLDASCIFIHRNGSDVAASLYQRENKRRNQLLPNRFLSLRCRNLARAFELWEEYNAIFARDALDGNKYSVHVLGYENLLADPQKEIAKIGGFLGIRFNSESIRKATSDIDSSRRYAFSKDKELITFHKKIKNSKFMRRFGYDSADTEF